MYVPKKREYIEALAKAKVDEINQQRYEEAKIAYQDLVKQTELNNEWLIRQERLQAAMENRPENPVDIIDIQSLDPEAPKFLNSQEVRDIYNSFQWAENTRDEIPYYIEKNENRNDLLPIDETADFKRKAHLSKKIHSYVWNRYYTFQAIIIRIISSQTKQYPELKNRYYTSLYSLVPPRPINVQIPIYMDPFDNEPLIKEQDLNRLWGNAPTPNGERCPFLRDEKITVYKWWNNVDSDEFYLLDSIGFSQYNSTVHPLIYDYMRYFQYRVDVKKNTDYDFLILDDTIIEADGSYWLCPESYLPTTPTTPVTPIATTPIPQPGMHLRIDERVWNWIQNGYQVVRQLSLCGDTSTSCNCSYRSKKREITFGVPNHLQHHPGLQDERDDIKGQWKEEWGTYYRMVMPQDYYVTPIEPCYPCTPDVNPYQTVVATTPLPLGTPLSQRFPYAYQDSFLPVYPVTPFQPVTPVTPIEGSYIEKYPYLKNVTLELELDPSVTEEDIFGEREYFKTQTKPVFLCRRYAYLDAHQEEPTDTHQRIFKFKDGKLSWRKADI